MGKRAYLVLENGKTFQGERFGADGTVMAVNPTAEEVDRLLRERFGAAR